MSYLVRAMALIVAARSGAALCGNHRRSETILWPIAVANRSSLTGWSTRVLPPLPAEGTPRPARYDAE